VASTSLWSCTSAIPIIAFMLGGWRCLSERQINQYIMSGLAHHRGLRLQYPSELLPALFASQSCRVL
jgi:hypothetical protein